MAQCAVAAKKACKILDITRMGAVVKTEDITLLLYKSSAVHTLSPVCHSVLCISKKDGVETVQKRTVKMVYGEE